MVIAEAIPESFVNSQWAIDAAEMLRDMAEALAAHRAQAGKQAECPGCQTPRACQYNGCAAALAASPHQVAQWQPIETAPRDGSEVLIFEVYERLPVIGWWSEKRKRWYASTEVYDTDGDATVIDKLYTDGVTHWMPLPAAPTKEPTNG